MAKPQPMPKIDEPAPADAEVWTAEDVARYLRCTARHVTNLAKRGELTGKRFGTIWRFRRQDIVSFR